jgi:hypothetical protein
MQKIQFIGALLFLGLAACNDGGSKVDESAAASGDTTQPSATVATDTHQHTADTTQLSTALPAIPDGAEVFFVNLKEGQTVKSPFKVQMGVKGIALDSAGIIRQASGHHHILIDAGDSLAAGEVVLKDSTHLHFGNAQSEAELKLAPGKHRITLQYADGIHRSYGSKLAKAISITVK